MAEANGHVDVDLMSQQKCNARPDQTLRHFARDGIGGYDGRCGRRRAVPAAAARRLSLSPSRSKECWLAQPS